MSREVSISTEESEALKKAGLEEIAYQARPKIRIEETITDEGFDKLRRHGTRILFGYNPIAQKYYFTSAFDTRETKLAIAELEADLVHQHEPQEWKYGFLAVDHKARQVQGMYLEIDNYALLQMDEMPILQKMRQSIQQDLIVADPFIGFRNNTGLAFSQIPQKEIV